MANQNTMADTTRVVAVDYDAATDLKKQYSVTKQHTFVLLNADGTMRVKTNQISTVADLNAFVSANPAPIGMIQQTVVAEAPVVGENPVTNIISTGTETTETSAPAVVAKTQYQPYSTDAVAQAHKNGKKVVLFFAADRCPSCVSADKAFSQEIATDKNLAIFKVDYDKETTLKQQYSITSQHTFVQVDAAGELIKKWSSSRSSADVSIQVQ